MNIQFSLLILSLLVTICVNSEPRPTGVLAPSGAWCWFQDPRAVQEGSTTYTGFVDQAGNITVTSLDHQTGKFLSIVVNKEKYASNDHNNPSLLISSQDKRIFVFWAIHSGPHMLFRRSIRPLDISEWGPIRKVMTNSPGPYGYTYPNPVEVPEEGPNIYLFWRGGSYLPTWSIMSYSNLNWKPAKTLIRVPGGRRPYVKVRGNEREKINFAFTEAHPRIRSLQFTTWKSIGASQVIGRMDDGAEPHQATIVYDAAKTQVRARIHDLALDPRTGHPVATFATIFNASYHRYHYARWDGHAWNDTDLVEGDGTISEDLREPHYSGGITLDPEDPRIVHISRDVLGQGIFEIERWTRQEFGSNQDCLFGMCSEEQDVFKIPSFDQLFGDFHMSPTAESSKPGPNAPTWKIETITKDSEEINVRPFSPVGKRCTDCPMSILWMAGKYPSYLKYQTKIKYTM